MAWLAENWTHIVAAVGAAVMLARIVVRIIPGEGDNVWLERVVGVLKVVGLYIPPSVEEVAVAANSCRGHVGGT